ncbi:EAL domain-containing protein [Alteromonas sp. 5E99-2]|uniref:putative bifunctional diguanylate cyclase/phosphodiesterase n=1 Tax=Alteromonas sp. 5E99-2 TaxID=2817683 RepID=UPI001F603282|nr:EAL domain-containing protein [Alteromonas sp. 5E99-2]
MVWGNQAALDFWGEPDLTSLQDRDFKTNMSEATRQTLTAYKDGVYNNDTYQEIWSFIPNGVEITAFSQFSRYQLEDGRMALLVEAFRVNDEFQRQYLSKTIIVATLTQSGDLISSNPTFANEFGLNIKNIEQLCDNKGTALNLLSKMKRDEPFFDDIILKSLAGEQWYRLQTTLSNKGKVDSSILIQLHNVNERKSLEVSLRKQALTDPLTQLLNRRGLTEKLSDLIHRGKSLPNYNFALLCIDLDGFKMVNDSFGHDMGDKVLLEVTKRLLSHCTNGSILSRFGGDEFIFCIEGVSEKAHVINLCNQILKDLSAPFEQIIGGQSILSASIGIAQYPYNGKDINLLISRADAAMFNAKQKGKNRCTFYQPGMDVALKRVSDISNRLMTAIKEDELQVFYQPITDVSSNKVVAFEALLRWFDDELGYINPEEAVKIAENMGSIDCLEYWVLNRALSDLSEFRLFFGEELKMSVNMSGMHMNQEGAAEKVSNIIQSHSLRPNDLTIELTEGVLVDNIHNAKCQAKELVSQGINLSIDDFGTGYSSLAYLHKMPAKTVKVDKAFVEDATSHSTTLKCIKTIANEFHMNCIIEGIESAEQSELLASLGYVLQQGYYFGKPQSLNYYRAQEESFNNSLS